MIPENIKEVLQQLNQSGYEAYIVGGAVRDMVLNVEPHDWDITTNAKPDEIKKVFNKTIDTGLKHGTVTAVVNKEQFEITTYRIDGDYTDGRHPDKVEFTTDLIEDLKRRDLTINAMACDIDGNIIDPFNGQKDLENHIIRAVGKAENRIQEDALRMLRAIRFSAKLGFEIDSELKQAISDNAKSINKISEERIESELTKIITSDNPEKIIDLYELGVTKYILPEFDKMMECEQHSPWHLYNVGMHSVKAMENVPKDKILRWTMLLHDVGKPDSKTTTNGIDHFLNHNFKSENIADDILTRLKFSNVDKKEILELIVQHDMHPQKEAKIRKFVSLHTPKFIEDLKLVQLADMSAQSNYKIDEKMNTFNKMFDTCDEIINNGTIITLKTLQINGNDLQKIGFKGKEIGEVLNQFVTQAYGQPSINNKEKLLKMAQNIYNKKHKNLDDIIDNATKSYNDDNINKEDINRGESR